MVFLLSQATIMDFQQNTFPLLQVDVYSCAVQLQQQHPHDSGSPVSQWMSNFYSGLLAKLYGMARLRNDSKVLVVLLRGSNYNFLNMVAPSIPSIQQQQLSSKTPGLGLEWLR